MRYAEFRFMSLGLTATFRCVMRSCVRPVKAPLIALTRRFTYASVIDYMRADILGEDISTTILQPPLSDEHYDAAMPINGIT